MTKKLEIIALLGAPGAGRKTAAALLQALGFKHVAIGDAVRAEVAAAWRVDVRMLATADTMEMALPALAAGMCSEPGFIRYMAHSGESLFVARTAAWVLDQWYDWRNRSLPGYFARIAERTIARAHGCGWHKVVVSDLNRPNEADMLQRMGARVLRVHRPELATTAQAGTVTRQRYAITAHADVLNDGSVHALGEAVAEALEAVTCQA